MGLLHATCVAIGGRGVLLIGASGSGKSDLALRLIDRGAELVSDDQTEVGVDVPAPLALPSFPSMSRGRSPSLPDQARTGLRQARPERGECDRAHLRATCPATIVGQMEIRGIGIIDQPALPSAIVALAVTLDRAAERMPDEPLPTRLIEGIAIPDLALAAFEASAPLKVERALDLYGLA